MEAASESQDAPTPTPPTDDEEDPATDICRVCRTEGATDRALFFPCLCTGSIKYVHQDCLCEWLKYSKKEYCELCNHKYRFQPIYHPDMPKRLPVRDVLGGVWRKVWKALRAWFHYTVVAVAWLGIVPLTASRIYRSLFTGSVNSLLMLPLDLISSENLVYDCIYGGLIIGISLCAFIALVWLREQILHAAPANVLNLPNHNGVVEEEEEEEEERVEAGEVAGGGAEAEGGGEAGEGGGEAAEAVEGGGGGNGEGAGGGGDEWRAFEWERAADELTWERLLGLDGSLVFLEHVFWVISLNTLFVLVFAFSPYHVGHFLALGLGLGPVLKETRFEGVLTTLFGYAFLCAFIFLIHLFSKLFRLKKVHKASGMMYLVLKVFLLVLLEVGIFPLTCGWWLDICSLSLFASSLRERGVSFAAAPGTSMFVHWLLGVVYVFYCASFILLLREVLRPGVLWFVRNLNDPEFNPIQEMIQYPVHWHVRRYLASLVLLTVTILVVIYLPVKALARITPNLLPYNITLNAETPVSELSLELLLLQVVLPALLEQSQARTALKSLIQSWCRVVGRGLSLSEYLLAKEEEGVGGEEAEGERGENLAEEHLALMRTPEPQPYQPFHRPTYFSLRITALLALLAFSAFCCSLISFSVPVTLGRWAMSVVNTGGALSYMTGDPASDAHDHADNGTTLIAPSLTSPAEGGGKKTHEVYTVAAGLYLCWLTLKLVILVFEWMGRGWDVVVGGVRVWSVVVAKCLVAGVALVGLIPYLVGLFFQLVVLAPVRVGLHQSPLFYPWQDWALGIVHCKIICAGLMMGPEWWIRRAFERVYQEGVRNLDLGQLYREIVVPVVGILGLAIAIPYAIAHTPLLFLHWELQQTALLQRHIYPSLLLLTMVGSFVIWQFQQFSTLVLRIRNEKYLVGQRLVNFDQRQRQRLAQSLLPTA